MKRGNGGSRPRSRLLVALLGIALVLTAVLAYQAANAERSHRRAAERALHDYASFAMWQLNQQASQELLSAMISTFIVPLTRVNPDAPESWPSPADFMAASRQPYVPAKYLEGVRFYFRFDWRDSAMTVAGEQPSDAVLRWVRDTVASYPRRFEIPEVRTQAFGSAGRNPARRLGIVITNDSYVASIDRVDGRLRIVCYVVSRDKDGLPLVTYGLETDANAFVEPVFRQVLDRTPLLPPSLVRGIARDSMLAVTAAAPQAGVVFRSARGAFPSAITVVDSLDERFGHMKLGVSLRSDIAPRLVVGGLPRSRLPMLAGLFALTVGLVIAALLQLRRQQQLAQLRVDFVSGVSHELRTPLAQIRLFAELLRNGQLRSEQERDRSIGIIDEEAQRLTYLVENVLAFSRSEHGRGMVAAEAVAMDREIEAAVNAFAPLARARRAKIRSNIERGLIARVDPRALRQIVLNLLDNAVKYGPLGQTVTVSLTGTTASVAVAVEDGGPGVPRAEREHIWEPYYRLARESAAAVGGSGIGLSIVRELVLLHGGRAWVEDAQGGGARFVVEFPRGDEPPAASAEVPLRRAAAGGGGGGGGGGGPAA
ncbi:MAG TPA: HAMP domain-containing sensor histidine kinase [Gemmatimonadaceae bacterium]|nr:HAMP domain-containing sensor histidine kinase [Gemmatimonadaceae bacterium]